MKLISLIFGGLLLSLFFAQPVPVAQAQSTSTSQSVKLLCVDSKTYATFWPEANGKCSTAKDIESVVPSNLSSKFKSICVVDIVATKKIAIYDAVDKTGKTSCQEYIADTVKYSEVVMLPRLGINGTDPYATATSPGGPVEPVKPKPKTTTPATKTSTTGGGGDCPSGFTSKGPLCIPENPFGNSDGIAGKGTVGELAAKIISSLLLMSGIVAVIMIIYGGYLFMTARGSEEQAKSGRKTLVNAIIGLVIVIMSYAVVQAVTNYLTDK